MNMIHGFVVGYSEFGPSYDEEKNDLAEIEPPQIPLLGKEGAGGINFK